MDPHEMSVLNTFFTPADYSLSYTQKQIEDRAQQITGGLIASYGTIDLLVVLLTGGRIWGELFKKILHPKETLFTEISLYKKKPDGIFDDQKLAKQIFTNKVVVIVDDIISRGKTMDYVLKQLQHPKKIILCPLINKPARRIPQFQFLNSYVFGSGFEAQADEFLVGYGMSWKNFPSQVRQLKNIYRLEKIPEDYLNQ